MWSGGGNMINTVFNKNNTATTFYLQVSLQQHFLFLCVNQRVTRSEISSESFLICPAIRQDENNIVKTGIYKHLQSLLSCLFLREGLLGSIF